MKLMPVICMHCKRFMRWTQPCTDPRLGGEMVSHGCCDACLEKFYSEEDEAA